METLTLNLDSIEALGSSTDSSEPCGAGSRDLKMFSLSVHQFVLCGVVSHNVCLATAPASVGTLGCFTRPASSWATVWEVVVSSPGNSKPVLHLLTKYLHTLKHLWEGDSTLAWSCTHCLDTCISLSSSLEGSVPLCLEADLMLYILALYFTLPQYALCPLSLFMLSQFLNQDFE